MHLRRGVLIGRPFGIPLVVHGSWFPAAALLVLHFTLGIYARLPTPGAVALAVVSSGLFFASLVAHELAHALVAKWMGIPVLDITLFVFGGVARIGREPARPSQELLIASAGPVASAVIGASAFAFASGTWLGHMLWTIGLGNLALAAFNLLPGFPLDGGRILRACLWWRSGDPHASALVAARGGQGIGLLLALGGIASWIFTPGDVEGAWLIVLGAFLLVLATASRRATRVAARLGGESAGRFASPFAGTLAPDEPLVLRRLVPREPWAVATGGRLAGIVNPDSVSSSLDGGPVRDAMVPWTASLAIQARQPLTRALERLAGEASGILVVVDDAGSVIGVLHHAGVRAKLDAAPAV